ERLLDRLEHDAHAAAPDLAHEPEVAEQVEPGIADIDLGLGRRRDDRPEPLLQRRMRFDERATRLVTLRPVLEPGLDRVSEALGAGGLAVGHGLDAGSLASGPGGTGREAPRPPAGEQQRFLAGPEPVGAGHSIVHPSARVSVSRGGSGTAHCRKNRAPSRPGVAGMGSTTVAWPLPGTPMVVVWTTSSIDVRTAQPG